MTAISDAPADGTVAPDAPVATLVQALAAVGALGIDRLDAQLLLLHVLGHATHDRAWLLAHDHESIKPHAWTQFVSLCTRRLDAEPVAYLIGQKEFRGLALCVDARVLVPRPETETLVDWALERMAPLLRPRVLDLGTGSGAIALALRHARADARIDAIDASADALVVARGNGERLGLDVRWAKGDWLEGAASGYDVIVANPPYVAEADAHLPALRHEPIEALAAGPDGLADLRRIIAAAPRHLATDGWLLLEHGHNQAGAVTELLRMHGFVEVQSRSDLAGIARCSGGQRAPVK
ncbi:MAG: peptide chain release factor N(5)-glutamine methyltransferase [Variovorax sp.]